MAIRRDDVCAACDAPLAATTKAWWCSIAKSVTCTDCRPADIAAATRIFEPALVRAATTSAPPPLPPPVPIDHGTGGISAQKEYDRRSAQHDKQIEEKWGTGRLGKVAKFFATEPRSTTARAKGADGEVKLARHLDRDLDGHATMLHDRKVRGTRGNIDHLVIAPSGIWIVDAKNYAGKIECRDVGNWRSSEQRLYVGGRNESKLLDGMGWQADAVQASIDKIGLGDSPIHRCLCFTDADWGFFSKPFTIEEVWVGWDKALVEAVRATPVLDPVLDEDVVTTLSHHLSAAFPAST